MDKNKYNDYWKQYDEEYHRNHYCREFGHGYECVSWIFAVAMVILTCVAIGFFLF